MSNFKNYYDVLGIPQNATSFQIEQAYQKLSGEWHPDRHRENRRNAEQRFHDISEAYETLSNKNRRSHYDELFNRQYSLEDANQIFQRFYDQYGVEDANEKKFFEQHYPGRKRNYYDVLEVPRNASFEEIKKSFRRLALKYHPKTNPGNEEAKRKFIEVTEAFNALEDESKRENYNDLVFNRQIAPVRAHDIFEDFWGNRVFEMPPQQQFFKPILKKKWSNTLDKLMDGQQGWQNIDNGETVKTSTVYQVNNGVESKKTVTTRRKIENHIPTTTTTEQYEFPNGTKEVKIIKDDGRGSITTDIYNLKKGEKLPIGI